MRNKPVLISLTLLVLAALACGSGIGGSGGGGGGGSGGGGSTAIPTAGGPAALFKDDFSDSNSGWDDTSNENGSNGYVSGEYVITVKKTDWFRWGNASQDNLSDIHIETTAQNTGTATDATFGVMCHYVDTKNYDYVGIGSDGYDIIAKDVDGTDQTLSKGTDKVPQNKASYQMGVDCGNGKLALYVNGKQINSAADSTFTTGKVGLFAWSSKNAGVEVHFDDFVVTALK